MTRKEPKPSKDKLKEAVDRTELFHDFIVNYIIHHSVYKLDKEYSKYIDIALESLEKGQEIISKKIKEKDE
jgi:hypothetical protein|tara:strand:- start:298 stop:510 length:213 start_codon:yes stop_codon:yes gene_type:complete